MPRCKWVIWIALFVGVTACSLEQGDELGLGAVESAAKPQKDAGVPDSPPPPPDAPADGPVDAPAPPDGGGGGTSGFIDACLLPGMTKATFTPTSTFDAHDEGVTAVLDLPFAFTFYGVAHTKYWFTSNGQLGFGSTIDLSDFGQVTCPLPDARFSAPILLAYSADLVGRYDPGAGVCYATTGTAPNRKLVVTWKDSFFYEAWLTSNVTFSATLHEGANVVDVALERVDVPTLPSFETGIAAVVGRQAGSSAQSTSCYQANAPEGTVVHYGP